MHAELQTDWVATPKLFVKEHYRQTTHMMYNLRSKIYDVSVG